MDESSPSAAPAPLERHPDDLPPPELPAGLAGGSSLPRGVLWAAALFVVVLLIASWVALSNNGTNTAAPADDVVHLSPTAPRVNSLTGGNSMVGQAAPAVTYDAFTGGTGQIGGGSGRPTIVNFWSSTCPPCVAEMPAFEQAHQRFGDRVAIVGLDVQDRDDAARAMAARLGVTYPLGFDRTGTIIQQFGGIVLPTTIVIGSDGTIVAAHPGELHADEITALIESQLR